MTPNPSCQTLCNALEVQMNNQRPLEKQFPGEEAEKSEILQWAVKARKRIVRDIDEKAKLKCKNKKLRDQLAGKERQIAKLKQLLAEPEKTNSEGFFSWLFRGFRGNSNA